MNALLVIFRAVHYATAMLLFGEILFALLVAKPPAWRPQQVLLPAPCRSEASGGAGRGSCASACLRRRVGRRVVTSQQSQ